MFGTYRTILALAVVAGHLVSISVIGHYAVHGFFVLSGYLMTYIMINSYGFNAAGIRSFALNRFLRLYPAYWTVITLTVGIIIFFGESNARAYREFLYLPTDAVEYLQNISLVYLDLFPGTQYPRLSPPTWALTVELLFYMLIALGISRNARITTIWLLVSALYMAATHVFNLDYNYRYGIIFAGSLPFSLGAFIYHHRQALIEKSRKLPAFANPLSLTAVFVLNAFLAFLSNRIDAFSGYFYFGFYFNYVLHALLIVILLDKGYPFISKRLDSKIGDFSYPIYLLHWQIGFASAMMLWGEPIRGMNAKGVLSCMLTVAICIVISWLIIRFVDEPIQAIRSRVRENADKATPFRGTISVERGPS